MLLSFNEQQQLKNKNLQSIDFSANKQQLLKIKNVKPNKVNSELETVINGGCKQQEPKTYVIKDSYDYYKPKINVEMMDNTELGSVNEIHIKGWKIEKPIMEALNYCLPYISCLNTIK